MSRKQLHLGPLTKDGRGTHAPFQRVELDTPARITNSSSREVYRSSPWPVRVGADDHKQYRSKGF